MLKFQENCTIEKSFEDFILLIFILTDDFYRNVRPYSFQSYSQKFIAGDESHF